jgi:hypothetical protein
MSNADPKGVWYPLVTYSLSSSLLSLHFYIPAPTIIFFVYFIIKRRNTPHFNNSDVDNEDSFPKDVQIANLHRRIQYICSSLKEITSYAQYCEYVPTLVFSFPTLYLYFLLTIHNRALLETFATKNSLCERRLCV